MNYDVFISYKHTDKNGSTTQDFQIAQKLFKTLNGLGYSVFFSSASLESMGSSRYKSDIDDALDNAKAMVVILSDANYAYSQWVQYEWDSFYNDYLSGKRKNANLFTLTKDVNIYDLPRTLRNVQNFSFYDQFEMLCKFIENAVPKSISSQTKKIEYIEAESDICIISGRQVTESDIKQALALDSLTYDEKYQLDISTCLEWFRVNPDIYIMAKDKTLNKIVAYVNISPVTEDCYERIKKGDFIDTGISADMILGYDMPFPYSVYFSSIVIHPDYQNSEVFMDLYNAIINKFIALGKHEVYIKRMIADAVTSQGEKFCKLFGMTKISRSNHDSTLYEIYMVPPKFRILSKMTKVLYDYYLEKYKEMPYLFE